EPARVHVERAAALRLLADGVLRLALRADEQDLSALADAVAHEAVRVAEHLHRLLEIDDVDAVARAEDVRLHLRVPAAGLMPEVDARFEQILHRHIRHKAFRETGPCIRNARPEATTAARRVTGSSSPGIRDFPSFP